MPHCSAAEAAARRAAKDAKGGRTGREEGEFEMDHRDGWLCGTGDLLLDSFLVVLSVSPPLCESLFLSSLGSV